MTDNAESQAALQTYQCLDCNEQVDMVDAQLCARCMTQPTRIQETLKRILEGVGKADDYRKTSAVYAGVYLEGIHDNAQELLDAFDRQDRSNRLEREESAREETKNGKTK